MFVVCCFLPDPYILLSKQVFSPFLDELVPECTHYLIPEGS